MADVCLFLGYMGLCSLSISGSFLLRYPEMEFFPLPSLSISGSGKRSLLQTVRPNSVSCENRDPCILSRPKPVPRVSCQGYRRFAACRVFCFDTWVSLLFLYPGVANWVFSFHTLMSWTLYSPVHTRLLFPHFRIRLLFPHFRTRLLCSAFDIQKFSPLISRSSKWSVVLAFDTRESQKEFFPFIQGSAFSFYIRELQMESSSDSVLLVKPGWSLSAITQTVRIFGKVELANCAAWSSPRTVQHDALEWCSMVKAAHCVVSRKRARSGTLCILKAVCSLCVPPWARCLLFTQCVTYGSCSRRFVAFSASRRFVSCTGSLRSVFCRGSKRFVFSWDSERSISCRRKRNTLCFYNKFLHWRLCIMPNAD